MGNPHKEAWDTLTEEDFIHSCDCVVCKSLRDDSGHSCSGCAQHHVSNKSLRREVASWKARADVVGDAKFVVGALRARIALLEKVAVEAIAETRKWYSINIFFPPDEDIVKAIHRQYPGMVDRLSADMARRTCDLILESYNAALAEGKEGT